MTVTDQTLNDVVFGLIPFIVAGAALIVAVLSAERSNTWRAKYLQERETAGKLRYALADRRFTHERAHPAPVREWPEDVSVWRQPPAQMRNQRRMSWPGDNIGHLPVPYGDTLDALPLAPPRKEDLSWAWAVDGRARSWPPLNRAELMVEHVITLAQLEAPTEALPAVQTWQVPALSEASHAS